MSDAVTRLNAALEGRYTIERELGQGGMATVYLADDLKHQRKVALKVLKPELAAVVGAERFLGEITTTANLQHPHILPLFDSGEADRFLFYVMPYVEGETLRERLDREHQLPVQDAVRIASALANALDYAHRHDVIHRDIKPANILMHDGQPVVADFGVALAVGAAGGGRLTETGLSVGTPHYMSPEQASGDEAIGPPSDIYAVGCVLYEMLVGEPPYTGSSAQAVVAKIITKEPEAVREHRKSVPANVEAAVRKALERLPADRFATAGAFAGALADPAFTDRPGAGISIEGSRIWKRVAAAAAVLAAVFGITTSWALTRTTPADVSRYSVLLPPEQALDRGQLRPRVAATRDGSRLIYVSRGVDGVSRLLMRRRDELTATALPGTERALAPFVSPDGQQFGFMRGGAELWTATLGGGAPALVDSGPEIGLDGASWGDDDFIYYDGLTGDGTVGIMRVPVSGGAREQVTTIDRPGGEVDHVWPYALPNGRGVVFTVLAGEGGLDAAAIGVADARTGEHSVVVLGVSGRYVDSGHLLYVMSEGRLMAQRFDLDRLETEGEAIAVAEGLSIRINASVDLAVSPAGVLYYGVGAQNIEPRDLMWVDRQGSIQPIDPGWAGDFRSLALSPDGSRAVVAETERSVGALQQLYVKNLGDGGVLRLTFEGSLNADPAWTPDGSGVVFASDRAGTPDIFVKRADGSIAAEPLLQSAEQLRIGSYSPDGEWMMYVEAGTLYAQRPASGGDRVAVLDLFFAPSPRLSPNGRFLAYESNESGRAEVYVVPFPSGDWRRQVSSGGRAPLWSRDGQELFYATDADEVVAVEVLPGETFQSGARSVLFSLPVDSRWDAGLVDVSPDGRFLMMRDRGTASGNELIVVEGFFEELERLVPD